MRASLSLFVFLTVPAFGQSALPACNPNVAASSWTNCQGTLTWANGDKYVGAFRDGKRHGQGTHYFSADNKWKADRFVGEWRDDKRHGQGTLTWANGDKYVGEFMDGKRHGQGTHTFANGEKYVGEYRDDKWSGQGTYYYLADNQFKGDKYVGEYRDDKPNGQGTQTRANGDRYVGEYRDGKRHGQGIYTFADGRPPAEGVFENDNFVRAQRIPDHIAGRISTTPIAQAPRQAEHPPTNRTYAWHQDAIRSHIRSLIRFDPAKVPENPEVIFMVEQLPSGQISKIQLKKPSGRPDWDAAVERAINASDPLPKAEDGTVERVLELRFRPRERLASATAPQNLSSGLRVARVTDSLAWSYQRAVSAHIKARINFNPERLSGNPLVTFLVTQETNGTIVLVDLLQSSGSDEWDKAVEKAIKRSSPLPLAIDGSMERRFELIFAPKERTYVPRANVSAPHAVEYIETIAAHIKRNILEFRAPSLNHHPEQAVIFSVRQDAQGNVRDVNKEESSGVLEWDHSVEKAIWKSSPLPLAEDSSFMSHFSMRFRWSDNSR